ncbi:Cloroperoxidase [Marasmius fiardii PR-910]|nr:Cloroperoxidase [Marasmius fiardii PR-910]
MKIQFAVTSLIFASSLTTASTVLKARDPHDEVDWSQHQFQAPTATDSRGPCPGLNTLANHGFLPHNGKNITLPIVLQAALDGFNVHPELLITAAKAALFTSNLVDQFELQDIALHGNIEHDASLSREDHALGNNLVFNETIFSTLANSNPGSDFYNTTSAAQVQKARLEQSRASNPSLRNTIKEIQVRTRESGLYLAVMGNPMTGIAPKQFVNIFFREERMPLAEGWKKSSVPVTGQTDGPLFGAIFQGSQWQPEAGQCPWVTLAPGAPEDPVNDGSIL